MAAATNTSIVLTQDLRAAAQDYKRDSEHKHKWELGEAWGPGRSSPAHPRPRKPSPKYVVRSNSLEYIVVTDSVRQKIHKGQAAKGIHRQNIVADRHEVATDSSADEEVEEPSAAPAPDAEVAYSYDAKQGPSHGSQVLGVALEKAVAKFENNETEKLVRDEYEVLGSDGEAVANQAGKKAGKASDALPEEDEYEFV